MFVIPMAGESRRFAEAGYREPKYRLPLKGAPIFDHAVGSFAAYFADESFLFVLRGDEAADFVFDRCTEMNIRHATIVSLDRPTAGQAETVLLGLERGGVADDEEISIFNIDTFRPGYRKPQLDGAGYLEVFRGAGEGWSFVAPDPARPDLAGEVAEKRPISDLCCTGLYHFRRAGDFRWAYANPAAPTSEAERRERYVAPLYNPLIARGERISWHLIEADQVIFCGTPAEYQAALRGRA